MNTTIVKQAILVVGDNPDNIDILDGKEAVLVLPCHFCLLNNLGVF